jgi:hypothetical protein
MDINQTVKKNNITVNHEGAKCYKDANDRALYNIAASFIYRNGGYMTDQERLQNLEASIDECIRSGDKDYVYALAWFLGKIQGIRLSPTLITTKLVDYAVSVDDWNKIEKIVKDVYTRPDFIANSLAYYKMRNNAKSISQINYHYKKILSKQLSSYNELTLKKRKMKRRAVKLADLIKVLRPFPKNKRMSKLYKAIIENDKEASLQVTVATDGSVKKADSGVAVLSSKKVSDNNKVKYLIENIDNLPLNELIRNAKQIPDQYHARIGNRLIDAFLNDNAQRFLNPFDLVLLSSTSPTMGGSYSLRNTFDNILQNYLFAHMDFGCKNPVILMDISASMGFDISKKKSINMAVLYLSFILPIILKNDLESFKYYDFDFSLNDRSLGIFTAIKKTGMYQQANAIADYFISDYKYKLKYGTSLRYCTKDAIQINPNCDGLFIFTDEVTWADNISWSNGIIPEKLHGKTFLFNVDPNRYSAFSKVDKITRVSGLDGKFIYMLNGLMNFPVFKENIIKLFNNEIS